ncbi:MAG: hypothetical protein ACQEVT_18410 [Pseudomonadota bacterium]
MAEQIGQMLMKAAREMGAEELRLEHGSKHPRLIGRFNDRAFMYVVPGSSSDWRAGRNALSGLRRLIGYEKPKPNKDGSAKGRSRKRQKARNASACVRAEQLSNSGQTPRVQREDRFHAPLAALVDQMRTAVEEVHEPDHPFTCGCERTKASANSKRIPLRTPWLGRRQRFQVS